MCHVLIVDDDPGMRLCLAAFLNNDGYEVQTAEDAETALSILETTDMDVVVTDIIMPGESGVQLLARIRERNNGVAVILVTGDPTIETAAEAVRLGAFDYVSKPVSKRGFQACVAKAARAKAQHDLNLRLAEENERYHDNLERLVETRTSRLSAALRGTLGVVMHTTETRDPYANGHQRSVAGLSLSLAMVMDLSAATREGVEVAALVHDVGKISTPTEILVKPSRLSPIEERLVRSHSQVGYDLLRHIDFPWPVADFVLQHHERLDGSGYPLGLAGDAIRLEARIIGVADVVDAMASPRPQRPALGIEAALAELTENKGRLYDPLVVDAALRLFRKKGYVLRS